MCSQYIIFWILIKWYLEIKIWAESVFITIGVLLFQKQEINIWCTHISIYIEIYGFIILFLFQFNAT